VTRSGLEACFVQICDAHGLPRPRINQPVAGRTVDFLFPRRVSSSRPTAGGTTARAAPSRTTVPATRSSPAPATARFTDHHLEIEPAVVAATIAGLLRLMPP
jgi:hypothetical protein